MQGKAVRIGLWSLGGTIAMALPPEKTASSGVTPLLGAEDLAQQIMAEIPRISLEPRSLARLGSANISLPFLLSLARDISATQPDAIVLTQGTDTMEETAYLLSLLSLGKPVVVTGAMRPASALSADGPANIRDACLLAEALAVGSNPLPSGVYLVINGDIHDPARVRKAHSAALNAFESDGGPLGRIEEGYILSQGGVRPQPDFEIDTLPKVRLVTLSLDDDPDWLNAAVRDAAGLVVESYGAGHVSEIWADQLEALALEMPVILASRTGRGVIYQNTYGYKGAEIDLIARGLHPAGQLCGRKARLALMVALSVQQNAETGPDWRPIFDRLSQ